MGWNAEMEIVGSAMSWNDEIQIVRLWVEPLSKDRKENHPERKGIVLEGVLIWLTNGNHRCNGLMCDLKYTVCWQEPKYR